MTRGRKAWHPSEEQILEIMRTTGVRTAGDIRRELVQLNVHTENALCTGEPTPTLQRMVEKGLVIRSGRTSGIRYHLLDDADKPPVSPHPTTSDG